LGSELEVEPVDVEDLGAWFSDYERRLEGEDEEEGDWTEEMDEEWS